VAPPQVDSPPLPVLTCSDGITNGSETDIDCGGNCPRCVNGQGCASRNDCAGAFCDDNVCQQCSTSAQCGTDTNGPCFCEPTWDGPMTCNKSGDAVARPATCAACPTGTHCISPGPPAFCVKPCGAA
jgi:hypothetical protein